MKVNWYNTAIEADHEYHIVELNCALPYDVLMWLIENFGPIKDGRWFQRRMDLYFKDPKDHLMFCLRWS